MARYQGLCVVTEGKIRVRFECPYSAHTATCSAPHQRHQGQLTVAQSDLEDCEQDLHKHCSGVLPYDLNFIGRCRLC
jgi:hypothetical protein